MLKLPEKIICEAGALEHSGSLLPGYGHKALIVTGPHVGHSPMMERLKTVLDNSGVAYEIFDQITNEPADLMISAGVAAYTAAGCDFCIGFGGGSPLDAAKAVAMMTVGRGEIADYMGKEFDSPVPPVVAIPTTAGTGSEATRFTIITDSRRGVKMLLKGDVLLPKLAIVDYTLGMGAPRGVTAATGLDAFTHAIEAYISRQAMPETDTLAIGAIKDIMEWLPRAYADGSNATAREKMARAALNAGICINNSSVTIVHGMSRPIGALFHVPHGLSNAMLLPTCLADLADEAMPQLAMCARSMGIVSHADGDVDAAHAFVDRVGELCRTCDVPTLRGYGIDEAEFMKSIGKMAADAIKSGSPANAPKKYSAKDCERLYMEAYHNQTI